MKIKNCIVILFIYIVIILNWNNVIAQNTNTIDSIKNVIKNAKNDTIRIKEYLKWDELIYLQYPDTSIYINLKVCKIAEIILKKSQSIDFAKSTKKYYADALNNLGYIYDTKGDVSKALECYGKSLKIQEEIKNKHGIASSLNNIGYVYDNLGNIPVALEYYSKSLKIKEESNDLNGMANSFNNIGTIYQNQGDANKALEYYNKSLKIQEKIGNTEGVAVAFNNIGMIYNYQANKAFLKKDISWDRLISKALEYCLKSLSVNEEINNKEGMLLSFFNIGQIYDDKASVERSKNNKMESDYFIKNALEYYTKSLGICNEIGDKKGMANVFNNIGNIFFYQNNLIDAKSYFYKSYKLSKELGYPDNVEKAATGLRKLFEKQKDFKLAFKFYIEEVTMHDSLLNQSNYRKTIHQQANYEYEKKAATDSIAHIKSIEIKNLQVAKIELEKKRQSVIIMFIIIGLFLVIIFAVYIFRSLRITRKQKNIIETQKLEVIQKNTLLNQQNEEISTQRDLVTEQKERIEEIHKEVTDSINYAKRIQEAVLPVSDKARTILGEHFVLFKPKDIVSGDFYWITKINNWLIVAVADCTGHGVPGAFMSMLGISFLTEIVQKQEIKKANLILNILRLEIINALQQKGLQGEQKDGMDISLLVVNTDTNQCQWAGANNPLYIVKSEKSKVESKDRFYFELSDFQLSELKGDKMPIAIYPDMRDFTNHEFVLEQNDCDYLYKEGLPDQFGGPIGKKYMYKQFKELLLQNSNKPMTEQREILEIVFEKWISNYEQIDDITVLGIRI